jgi:hypothetical protein
MKYKVVYLFLILFIVSLFLPVVHTAELSNYNISLEIKNNNLINVNEIWKVSMIDQNDLANFKKQLFEVNLDFDKLLKIDPNLRPHVYLAKYKDLTIAFDETHSSVRLNYDCNGLVLEKIFENPDEILWQFNSNFLKNFLVNNLYSIPDGSLINISVYDPLIIQDPLPKGDIVDNSLTWSGISANKLRVLLYEKKPPKPSFFLLNITYNTKFYYFLMVLILVALIVFIFRKRMSVGIKHFVVKHSEIKVEKQKDDLLDTDFLNK